MSKVDDAIKQAYDTLEFLSNHTKDPTKLAPIGFAMAHLKPFYKNPSAVYDEERRSWWIEEMDLHFDGNLKNFSEEQIDQMVKYLLEEDYDNDDGVVFDMLFKALNWNGLGGLVFGDECD